MNNNIYPFLQWAGEKRQIINKLIDIFPKKYNKYFEPFVGAGAVLFNLRPSNAIIGDTNPQLINTYNCIKENIYDVIELVKEYDLLYNDKDSYLKIRNEYNKKIISNVLDIESAAMMIYLNKHCFNSLYRVNSKGEFNVSYNYKNNVKSINEDNLINVNKYLNNSNIEIKCTDFECLCENVNKNDIVYFDPPYVPLSDTSNFNAYTKNKFTINDQERLFSLYCKLDKIGAYLILSNHNTPEINNMYKEFNIYPIITNRVINVKKDSRTGCKEVIITNFNKEELQ